MPNTKWIIAALIAIIAVFGAAWILSLLKGTPEITVTHVATENGEEPWPHSYSTSPGQIAVGCWDGSSPRVFIRLTATSAQGLQAMGWEIDKQNSETGSWQSVDEGLYTVAPGTVESEIHEDTYPDGRPIVLDLRDTGDNTHLRLIVQAVDVDNDAKVLETIYYKYCPEIDVH